MDGADFARRLGWMSSGSTETFGVNTDARRQEWPRVVIVASSVAAVLASRQDDVVPPALGLDRDLRAAKSSLL